MKFLGIFLSATAFLFSLNAHAFIPGGIGKFIGGGEWKSADGTRGFWESNTTLSKIGVGFQLKDNVRVYSEKGEVLQTEENDWTIKTSAKSKEFFEIEANGKKVGRAYCFTDACHLTFQEKPEVIAEETFLFTQKGIARRGSDNSKGELVAWDGFQKQMP